MPDPVSLSLLGTSAEAALRDDPFVLNDPMSRGLRTALVARSRFVEDELARRVAAGVRQYVLLGAGLDTFSYRSPYNEEGLRVFEVDHPATQRWKQKLLADAGIGVPPSLTFVPVDFERDDLGGALRQAGLRADQAACVSWLGVTMYLTADAVLRTLSTVARFAAGSCLCFDYRVPVTMLHGRSQHALLRAAQGRAAHGRSRELMCAMKCCPATSPATASRFVDRFCGRRLWVQTPSRSSGRRAIRRILTFSTSPSVADP